MFYVHILALSDDPLNFLVMVDMVDTEVMEVVTNEAVHLVASEDVDLVEDEASEEL